VQATFNMLDVSAGPALAAAHDAGLGVIVKEGVANGRLTARARELDRAGAVAAAERALTAEAARLDVTEDAAALAFVLAHPWVDVVLSGATTIPMLESNLAAASVADQVDPAAFAALAQPPAQYWAERAAMPWN
jgi:aryl-alcohol dehydrogenase-like predicted oxidoreductase